MPASERVIGAWDLAKPGDDKTVVSAIIREPGQPPRICVMDISRFNCKRCLDGGFEEVFSPHPIWPRYIVCPDCRNAAGEPEPPGLVKA